MKNKNQKSKTGNRLVLFPARGFTLLEMLIVVAIITLLASTIFIQVQTVRSRARDTEREKEIKTLQDALAIYVVNAGNYPVYTGALTGQDPLSTVLKNADALSNIPVDPLNTGTYYYNYDSADGSTYTITYYLETNTILGKSAGVQQASP